MNKRALPPLILLVMMATGCAFNANDKWDRSLTETDYQALKNEPVADHATRVQGVDLWSTGLPNKKYSVLGAVTDKRRTVGFSSSAYQQDIVSYIKKAGGDGGIILNSESKVIDKMAQGCGASPGNSSTFRCNNNFNAFYSPNIEGTDGPLEYRISHIVIIRYVP
jgi:hypothetical protein